MKRHYWISTAGMLVLGLSAALAQDSGTPPAGGTPDSGQQQPAPPAPAYGPDNSVAPISENPPLSGLDQPGLEPHAAPLSYLQPGVTIMQSADSNVSNTLGGSSLRSVTRGLGHLTLQRLWSNYDLALDYTGGVGYYNSHGVGFKAIQGVDLSQKILWKRGQLLVRDNFSYLPEGSFGGAYGSIGSVGNVLLGGGGGAGGGVFLSPGTIGSLGQVPRIMNLNVAEISQNLSPKSAITLTGGYGFVHFTGNNPALAGVTFLGSSEKSAQAGYNRVFTRHDQVALVYGYQGFDFSVAGTAFHTHVVQLMYGHQISGRMDFLVAAGPQLTKINTACSEFDLGNPHCNFDPTGKLLGGSIPNSRLSVAGRGQLRYRFQKATLSLNYDRYATSGSGFFAGAQSDIARLGLSRQLTRVWSGFADIGYSRNRRLQPVPVPIGLVQTCQSDPKAPGCSGVNANNYTYGYAGFGIHRQIGHDFHVFASYQFNELSFDNSFCVTKPCNRIGQRHVGTIGLDWTPRPIRID